jgi:hypothetical protein
MPNDIYGIKKLYPSSTTRPFEFVLPMHRNNIESANFVNSFLGTDINVMEFHDSNGVIHYWEVENEEEDDPNVELYISVPGVVDSFDLDCDLDFEEAEHRGSSRMASKEWLNTETTLHVYMDSLVSRNGQIWIENRAGFKAYKNAKEESKCCGGYGYGVDVFATSGDNQYNGLIQFHKEEWFRSWKLRNIVRHAVHSNYYQKWIGIKFLTYNKKQANGQISVEVEVYLSPSDQPEDYQTWILVSHTSDSLATPWTAGGQECGGSTNQPITWASPFTILGWLSLNLVRFKNLTVREIDPTGTFGEDPEPPPTEEPPPPPPPTDTDPDEPPEPPLICPIGQHAENGICVSDNPPTQPPDVPPPATITTLTKRLTIRREIINTSLCSCDGIPTDIVTPPPNPPGDPEDPGGGGGTPGGGGNPGGGGSNTLLTIYNVPLDTGSFAKLSSVDDSDDYYLRFGQGITQTNSPLIGKYVARIEITIAEKADPRGGTGSGVHCRIRKGSDDSIAATFPPVALEDDIVNAGKLFVFTNLDNEYPLVYGDKILFEYDGGNRNNYVKIFRSDDAPNNGTKTVWQDNEMDPGEYDDDADYDVCMRVYAKESIINPQHTEDDP